jgi:hypothetical protein
MFPALALTTGAALLLYLTGFFVILTPLPFALLNLKKGSLAAVVSFSLVLVILGLFYFSSATPFSFLPMMPLYPHLSLLQVAALGLFCFFYYGWIGLTLSTLSVSRWAGRVPERDLGIALGISLVPLAVLLGAVCKAVRLDLLTEFRGSLQFFFGRIVEMQQNSGLGEDELLFLKGHIDTAVAGVVNLTPALIVSFTLFVFAVNLMFLRRWISPLQKAPFAGWPFFPLWRLGEKWIWLPIAGGGLYFLNFYLLRSGLLGWSILNLLIIAGFVYFFQGLAIISFFSRKRLSPLMRMAGWLLIFLFIQMFAVVIIILGLFDFWFDFRKLKSVA